MTALQVQEAQKLAADWYRSKYKRQGPVKIVYPMHPGKESPLPEGDNWRLVIDEDPRVGVLVMPDGTVEEQETNFFKPNFRTRQSIE